MKTRVKVSLYFPVDLEKAIREEAQRLDRSLSWVVVQKLREKERK